MSRSTVDGPTGPPSSIVVEIDDVRRRPVEHAILVIALRVLQHRFEIAVEGFRRLERQERVQASIERGPILPRILWSAGCGIECDDLNRHVRRPDAARSARVERLRPIGACAQERQGGRPSRTRNQRAVAVDALATEQA